MPSGSGSTTSAEGGGVYTVPTGSSGTSSSGGYSFNPDDPYNLGSLAKEPIILGTIQTPALDRSITANNGQDLVAGKMEHIPAGEKIAHTDATSYMTDFLSKYGTNRAEFNALRQALANAGYYGSTPLDRIQGRAAGLWDVSAMRHALQDWTQYTRGTNSPLNINEWLLGGKDGNGNNAANTGAQSAGQVLQITDPNRLTQVLQGAARANLGHELTDQQVQGFIAAFQQEEIGAQKAAVPGAVVAPPDASADAASFIRQQYGTQQSQHAASGYMNAMLNLFLPGNESRPATNTDPYATA